ncbi:MAG: AMP-binding protein [Pirellulales bacterium]|nr:AMP-binding protein [Pirellulales bacterium]
MLTSTIYDLLEKNLGDRAEHPAVVEQGQNTTYAELARRADALAGWLQHVGVRRGDRVGIHLHKSAEELVATFAAARLGAVFVNIYYQWTVGQVDYVLRDCDVKILLVDSRRAKELAEAELPDTLDWIVVKGPAPEHPRMVSWSDLPADLEAPRTKCIDTDLTAILYTSGSSGQPKGVMLTHLNIIQGARSVATYLKNTRDDRVLGLLPMSFDYGMNQVTTMCLVGGTVVLQKVPMPAEIVRTLASERVTGMAGIPPTWIEVVRYLQSQPTELPHLRYVTNSGGSIPKNILEAMPKVFPGADIYLMYGLTEAFRSAYLPPEKFHAKMGSMGMAIPNVELFVVDAERGLCGPGQQGELVHRGSLISKGYWGKPEATAEKIKVCPHLRHLIGDEKVLYSGDIVRMDEEGYLWFVSRADAMIKSSGVRVSPTEVEDIVYQSKMVRHCVAFGAASELHGQVVHVIVSPLEGRLLDPNELMHYCRKFMPPYMVPHAIYLWPGEMPRTGSGKLDRQATIAAVK